MAEDGKPLGELSLSQKAAKQFHVRNLLVKFLAL